MTRTRNRLFAAVLTMAFIFAVTSDANAQSWRRYRDRDRDFSGGQRAAIIGGSAAAGAVLGGLLGGKKGAVLGAVLGGGAGTAGVVIHDRSNNDRWDGWERRDGRFYRGRVLGNRFVAPRYVGPRYIGPPYGRPFVGVRGFRGSRCR